MDFQQSIKVCFQKYSTFEGRAARSEYWWFVLFILLISIATNVLDLVMFTGLAREIGVISLLIILATLLPELAVTTRRLHDVNRSGWWQLLWLVPILGWIPLIYWTVIRGTDGPNDFGANPL